MFSSERCLFSSGGCFLEWRVVCFRIEDVFEWRVFVFEWRVVCFRIEDVFE